MLPLILLLSSCEVACTPRAPLSIDVTKLRLAAHTLLVASSANGSGAAKPCFVPTVDTIDRQLTVTFDLPELSLPPEGPNPFVSTCGRSWKCGCLHYELCPGMQLTTAMTRDFGTVNDTTIVPPTLSVRPRIQWCTSAFEVAPCARCPHIAGLRRRARNTRCSSASCGRSFLVEPPCTTSPTIFAMALR